MGATGFEPVRKSFVEEKRVVLGGRRVCDNKESMNLSSCKKRSDVTSECLVFKIIGGSFSGVFIF